MAVAGGVNLITSPGLYQNLAGASFLSPTGASKAFDAGANDYCRGEGVGVVVLKTLPRALADDNSVLAVIRASAVNQAMKYGPITVPVSASQTSLYRKALSTAGVDPRDVTYVEAHGTGNLLPPRHAKTTIKLTTNSQRTHHSRYRGYQLNIFSL